MTFLYVLNIVTLMTQQYDDPVWVDQIRGESKEETHSVIERVYELTFLLYFSLPDIIYLCFTVVYALDITVRLAGLGWRSFRENLWNLYDLAVVTGTLATTIPLLRGGPGNQTNIQFQKIFLTGVAFKLVQKNNALNQLFKTAV